MKMACHVHGTPFFATLMMDDLMRWQSWLTVVARGFLFHKTETFPSRRRKAFVVTAPAFIEKLENRLLLYAAPVDSPTLINTDQTGNQSSPDIATDQLGNFVVVWISDGQDGSGAGIYAQRHLASGIAQGSEFRVNTETIGDQSSPSVAMNAAGSFVITWQSGSQNTGPTGIYAQLYTANGVANGGQFKVNTSTDYDQVTPSVAMDAAGDFVIVWQSNQALNGLNRTPSDILGRHYQSTGTASGNVFLISTIKSNINSQNVQQFDPRVSMDADGDFVVVWSRAIAEQSDWRTHIIFRKYDSAGLPADSFDQQITYGLGQQSPSVAIENGDNFVITWQENSGGGIFSSINAALIQGASYLESRFQVHPKLERPQQSPRIAMDASGEFAITWRDGIADGLALRQFDATGNPQSDMSFIDSTSTGKQDNGAIAMNPHGSFIVAWQSPDQTGASSDIYAQRFHAHLPPTLSQIEPTILNFVGPQPATISSTLVVASDSSNLAGATIQITTIPMTNHPLTGEDVLGFSNTATITGAWNSGTGILTLTGVDTPENYTRALRNITYQNISPLPDTSVIRTVTFLVTDGQLTSLPISRDLTVRGTSNSPLLKGGNQTITYDRNAPAIVIAPDLVITSLGLASATVTLSHWQPEDRLEFHNIYALQHSFREDLIAHTAVLTITGNATADQYQTLLRSVVYWDVSNNPNTLATRVAQFAVIDSLAQGGSTSQSIVVSTANAINLPPVVDLNHSPEMTYVVPAASVAPFSTVLITDPDSHNLTGLTIQITSGYQNDAQGHDLLAFSNAFGTHGEFDSTTGTLKLMWGGYVGNYREALRLVQFSTSGTAISTATRTLTVIATDDANPAATSVPIEQTVKIRVDAAPLIYQIETNPLIVIGQIPVPVTSTLLVTDQDSDNLVQATIQISSNYQPKEDVLRFQNTRKITGTWDSATGILSLNGVDSVSNYRLALRSIHYQNLSNEPNTAATRTLTIQVNDGYQDSDRVSRDLTVQATLTSPIVSGITSTQTYLDGAPEKLMVAPDLVISSLNLYSATVSFTNWRGEDRIEFSNIYALQHTFTENLINGTATLKIAGTDTADHYQTLLRSVVYWNVSKNPDASTRVARFVVTDLNGQSGAGVQSITVQPVNDPPTVLINDATPLVYQATSPSIAILSQALVADPDSNRLSSLTVQITAGYQNDANGQDQLLFTDQFGIHGEFDASTGTLKLQWAAYVGFYREALRQVQFSTSGTNVSTATRVFTIIASDDESPLSATSEPVLQRLTVTPPQTTN